MKNIFRAQTGADLSPPPQTQQIQRDLAWKLQKSAFDTLAETRQMLPPN